jgi:hypothetical protein
MRKQDGPLAEAGTTTWRFLRDEVSAIGLDTAGAYGGGDNERLVGRAVADCGTTSCWRPSSTTSGRIRPGTWRPVTG